MITPELDEKVEERGTDVLGVEEEVVEKEEEEGAEEEEGGGVATVDLLGAVVTVLLCWCPEWVFT